MSQDRDFVLELDGLPGSYRLHVSSPAGDDSAAIEFDPASLGIDLDSLQAQVLASATTSRAVVPELERPLRRMGQALFEAVFQASTGALFLSSRNEIEGAGDRLRIVLRLHPPELAMLPWELLFSDNYGGYLCRRSPMVRYVSAPEPVRPLTVNPPLRVLGMTALPGDLAALDADTERGRMQQVLAPLQARGLVAVDWVPGQSWQAAQDALYAGCQVFHFIGHGRFDPDRGEGVIAFADERGRRQLVGASALAELLSVADPMPRLVVLNSCQTAVGADTDVFSGTAATLVRTVPAVVAMQFAITDDAATVFSRAFYQALVHNRGVDEAVRAGRIALTGWNADTLEWVTPVLYLRSRDTRLFALTEPGAAPAWADDQLQSRREAVMAAYWAARSTGDWEPVIAQLGALVRQLPGDGEIEQAYQDARLAARYEQGRRAEQDQDWSSAVADYQAISKAQPEYRDVAARLRESSRRRDIATLQERLRLMFTAGKFQAVVGIAGRLAELDPAAADPDGLGSAAREEVTRRQEAERAVARRREQAGQLQQQIREHAAAQDWEAVLAVNDRLAELDPAAADPDGLASAAREEVTRGRRVEQTKIEPQQPADERPTERAEVRRADSQRSDNQMAAVSPSSKDSASPPALELAESATRHRRFPWHRLPRPLVVAGILTAVASLTVAIVLVSRGGNGKPTPAGGRPTATIAGFQALNPGTGSPQRGGTLNMVGISDVIYMDYDLAYYATDYLVMRLMVRQLYSWPAVPGHTITPSPDLATALPAVSDNGLKQTVTIRSGVMWNTSPPRPVTGADVVRGIKRACNPSPASFGGMADFEATIKGLSAFCAGYPSAAGTSAAALKSYVEGHNVSGITASGNTITFSLTRPAPWLVGAMTMGAFSATPVEALNGLPGTPAVYSHMYSNGPYEMTSYTPKKSIHFVRNPVWNASSDPLRKAYVNTINVDETGNQTTIYQQMPTGSASLGMSFDALVPPADNPNLLNQLKSGSNHSVNLGATYSSNPYLVFNTVSPNNGGALGKAEVRQALSYGIERSQLQKVYGGAETNPALTHILPPGIDGSQDVPAGYNPYPYDQAKAKSMLQAAGFTASHPLQIKFLYRSDSQGSTAIFNSVVTQLGALGSVKVTGVPTNQSDFYVKYLFPPNSSGNPSPAYKGTWDMASAGWVPDWYGNSAMTFFNPLYSSPGGFPANGGSNYGYFQSNAVNTLINQALNQSTESEADVYWAEADEAVMQEAAIYPISSQLQFAVHAPYVHNAVFMAQYQNFDPANVWLSTP